MGIIAAITPGKEINHVVPRKNVSALNVTELSKIDIVVAFQTMLSNMSCSILFQ
jgi:hypothetical protein